MVAVEDLLDHLRKVTKRGSRWAACCPAHDDRHASLSICRGKEGRILLKCFAGCQLEAICEALGIKVPDLMPESKEWNPQRNNKMSQIIATYDYVDEAGNLLYQAVRMKPKKFLQRRPDGNGDWIWKLQDVRLVLYHLPELLADTERPVFVVEGEKDVHSLKRLGYLATCSAGGADNWKPEYADYLKHRDVVILPDNDAAGYRYAEKVATSLQGISHSIKVIALPDLLEKGDVSDWIEDGGTREQLDQMVVAAPEWTPEQFPKSAPPKPKVEAYQPFPVDALPDPVRAFVVNGAKAIGCDASFLVLPLLSAIGAAIGTTRRLEIKPGWQAPPVIWTAIVGESGTAKTPAFGAVLTPIQKLQNLAFAAHAEAANVYEQERLLYEKQFQAWKSAKSSEPPPVKPDEPQPARYMVKDTTVEALALLLLANQRGLLVARDELSGWFGGFNQYSKGKGGSDASHWLSMFNGETLTVDRKTGNPKTIHVPHAMVSITGGIQPSILKTAISGEHRESGMAARFLFAMPPRTAKRWTEAGISPESFLALEQLFKRLLSLESVVDAEGNPTAELVRFSDDAKTIWIAFYNGHAEDQAETSGDLASAYSKLEEYAARLALIIHFIRWAANDNTLKDVQVVDATSLEAAIALVEWFKREARRLYDALDESAEQAAERKLVEWIGKKGGKVTQREVQQGMRQLSTSAEAKAALQQLVDNGYGRWEELPPGSKGGRPTQVFVLPSVSTVYETPKIPEINQGSVDVDVSHSTIDEPQDDWGEI